MFISRKNLCAVAIAALAAGCGHTDVPAPSQVQKPSPPATAAAPSHSAPSQSDLQLLAPGELHGAGIASGDSCNVEAVGGSVFGADPVAVTEKSTTISGWFLSAVTKKVGVTARLQLIAEGANVGWQMPIQASVARPDVLSVMGGLDSGNVGFSQAIDLTALPSGTYKVILAFDDAGQKYVCDKERAIVIP